ncbi:uncharacterized protein KY384_004892 [Bacidia gigantensis]|uniref:uncharacterized protein n=1 Tax=Bacidia gigantensis TaxID=2732470 RepID=UPI001D042D24|nr:uncharacterized protein KY384_004892 [Bacidia gigantensis]KAG8530390.1 hypothetical protein KY384_004892 [Bacidia gigantensis]
MKSTLIDVHTHIYPPAYLRLLRSRKQVPYLLDLPNHEGDEDSTHSDSPSPRLIILPSDNDQRIPPAKRGRPLDSGYSSVPEILEFMDVHGIGKSILSLANPWLDFLPASEGPKWALTINQELEEVCASSEGRLYTFGALPLSAPPPQICEAIQSLGGSPHVKGVIIGTSGLGQGLDDPALEEVYATLQQSQTLVFLHPHYGLPSTVYGPRAHESGHVLHLSLGFPLETTISFTRMYVSGVFDRFPRLKILIAHAGATIPFLAGRISSCIEHERLYHDMDGTRVGGPERSLQEVLTTNVWVDAVVYSASAVQAAADVVGRDRVLFGTDHPFFPPLKAGAEEWMSVKTNVQAVREAFEKAEVVDGILGGNATKLLDLP